MQLPDVIQTYFTARAPQDGDALEACFAPDAVVHDEGRSHHGPEAIRAWWLEAKAKYRHHAEPQEATRSDEGAVVQARVSGDFPGSPAMLRFDFALEGGRITTLRIG